MPGIGNNGFIITQCPRIDEFQKLDLLVFNSGAGLGRKVHGLWESIPNKGSFFLR